MIKINWTPSKKQKIALDILFDRETTEFFYGGGAGGGKSYIGCIWLILSCLKYQGSRWLMGRAVLKSLKESTLLTFFMICNEWGLKKNIHYKYNSIEGIIRFFNGSEIYLKDLFAYPSDPEFDSLGSTEYTGVFLDEASQITIKAKNIVMSRIRYKLEEFDLVPKLFIASNPSKNFLYYDYYKPWKAGSLPKYRKFLPALVQDNPFISPFYIENLKKLDKTSKQRLLYGNFEYDDDDSVLIDYDKIISMFGSTVGEDKIKYLTVDVARGGKDKLVYMFWQGLHVYKVEHEPKSNNKKTRKKIEIYCENEKISRSKVIVDEDGVGGGIVDETEGVKGFVNNSKAIQDFNKEMEIHLDKYAPKYNFKNLKSQCYYRLADYINASKISIYSEIPIEIKEELIEELEQIKRKDMDKDAPLQIIGKDIIKQNIGRSPDFADALMMRMYFEVNKRETGFFFG